MNGVLLVQTWRWQAVKLAIVALCAVGWGWLLPLFYAQFSDSIRTLAAQNPLFQQLSNFGSGSLLTLPGTVTLGTEHPIAIALLGVFAIGMGAVAVAGERQRGTLEVLLARPIPRRGLVMTLTVALLGLIAVVIAAMLAGMTLGAATQGVFDQLNVSRLPLVWVNGFLLWSAFGTFAIAASVSFDRSGPAIGLSLAYLMVNYFLEILGTFVPAARWAQEYSLFHHFQPTEILTGSADPLDFVLLLAVAVIPLVYALVVFPRRDLPAPG